ncbi:MAG: FHA domain-containing protein [Deltaproteobacteria bacterium]|nr:FHA domain-containing protein [Deltaproteobacteria bacterium]MDQ3301418.1 FHA domain-containing protein [Myxococcota bacterium]
MDQSKKTMRHFYCRDVLWETFEQMANDFDCSIDYLVNEAMRYYARSKNYQSPGGAPNMTGGNAAVGNSGNSGPTGYPAKGGGGPERGGNTRQPPPGTQPPPGPLSSGPTSQAPQRRPAPPTPGYAPAGGNNMSRPPMSTGGMGNSMASHNPAPQIHQPAAPIPQMSAGPTLFLIYNGQRYPVTKDQFIIGRGSKTSDLPIKDGNISRKHAAVIRRNGTFYIKDLGSTNGIDYKGMRIDNKRIDEGDVFHLCDYELRFTYRAD